MMRASSPVDHRVVEGVILPLPLGGGQGDAEHQPALLLVIALHQVGQQVELVPLHPSVEAQLAGVDPQHGLLEQGGGFGGVDDGAVPAHGQEQVAGPQLRVVGLLVDAVFVEQVGF